jgi:hypothetical protein
VKSGCLQKLQLIKAEEGSKFAEYINAVNSCFPPEIVQYYSPGYAKSLMQKLDGGQDQA